MQGRSTSLKPKDGKLPGFHTSSVRLQMLSNFANLIRTNQFKIRSKRVISELQTWIWKNGRPDHMDGCHDDTITCLAMGMFVVQFSLKKQEKAKALDNAMMKAMILANSRLQVVEKQPTTGQTTKKSFNMPVYINKQSFNEGPSAAYKASMWLLK